eukprot:gene11785-biopygen7882
MPQMGLAPLLEPTIGNSAPPPPPIRPSTAPSACVHRPRAPCNDIMMCSVGAPGTGCETAPAAARGTEGGGGGLGPPLHRAARLLSEHSAGQRWLSSAGPSHPQGSEHLTGQPGGRT